MDFEAYSNHAVHFFSLHIPDILRAASQTLPADAKIIDLGCGDGNLVFALKEAGLIDDTHKVTGVDLSELRVQRFQGHTGYPGIVSTGDHVAAIADESIDLVITTMVIEHVPDDAVFLAESRRMLKPGGRLYVTTVFKKPGAWYFRRAADGRWVLDATHLREYASREAFESLVRDAGYTIETVAVHRLLPPLAHPLLRIVNRIYRINNINQIFLNKRWGWLEKLRVPIPRYREIQIVAKK